MDLVLLLREPSSDKHLEAIRLVNAAQAREETMGTYCSIKLHDRDWVEDRRAIESFFMREIDRDKIVLHGAP